MNLTQQSSTQTAPSKSKRPLVNQEDALWKGICIQFKDACRLELLGNKDEAQLWLKKKVSPFINMWAKECKLPVEDKKTRLRAQMITIRKETELELNRGDVDKPSQVPFETPFKHPEVAKAKPLKKPTPSTIPKSPYMTSYAQHAKGRVSRPRLPISDISSMIDAVQNDSETFGTAKS